MTPTLINNGKSPDDYLNVSATFWLPPDTPFGNLTAKLMKLILRLDQTNRRLIESFEYWSIAVTPQPHPNAASRHEYATEEAIYMMRRAADDLIAMISFLSDWQTAGKYPSAIRVDCIGALIENDKLPGWTKLFTPHTQTLRDLNEVSNAFKHSFIHGDTTRVGVTEPMVTALALKRNKLQSGIHFHCVLMRDMVNGFNAFYADCFEWLRAFSVNHRPGASAAS